jgi:hypothetical protein
MGPRINLDGMVKLEIPTPASHPVIIILQKF